MRQRKKALLSTWARGGRAYDTAGLEGMLRKQEMITYSRKRPYFTLRLLRSSKRKGDCNFNIGRITKAMGLISRCSYGIILCIVWAHMKVDKILLLMGHSMRSHAQSGLAKLVSRRQENIRFQRRKSSWLSGLKGMSSLGRSTGFPDLGEGHFPFR